MPEGVRIGDFEEQTVQRFAIDFEPEQLETFQEDPDAFLLKVLGESGRFEVNSAQFLGTIDRVAKDGGVKCYHVISPEAEKSNTVCF